MDFDCKTEMAKAKRMALVKLTSILDESGGSLDSDELNDMHHALEVLQLIRDLECEDDRPAPAPETPPASGGTTGNGNGNGGASHPAADLTGIMTGMERLLGMVAQLVTAVAGQGNGGTSGTTGAPGMSGSSGTSGTPGMSGAPGTSGTPGATGTTGTTGATGTGR